MTRITTAMLMVTVTRTMQVCFWLENASLAASSDTATTEVMERRWLRWKQWKLLLNQTTTNHRRRHQHQPYPILLILVPLHTWKPSRSLSFEEASAKKNVIPSFASTRCCVDGGHRSTTSTLGCSTNTILHTSGSLPPLTSIAANLYSNLLVHHTEESNSRTRNAATVGER